MSYYVGVFERQDFLVWMKDHGGDENMSYIESVVN